MNIKACMTGNSTEDTFSLDKSFISMTSYDCATDLAKEKSNFIITADVQLILEAVKFGRNILQNIRQFC